MKYLVSAMLALMLLPVQPSSAIAAELVVPFSVEGVSCPNPTAEMINGVQVITCAPDLPSCTVTPSGNGSYQVEIITVDPGAVSGTATLTWKMPTARMNGDPLSIEELRLTNVMLDGTVVKSLEAL